MQSAQDQQMEANEYLLGKEVKNLRERRMICGRNAVDTCGLVSLFVHAPPNPIDDSLKRHLDHSFRVHRCY